MPGWLKTTLKIVFGFIAVILLLFGGITLYISYNKAKFLKLVNTELLKTVNGVVTIGDMSPQFIKGFPNVSLRLNNVLIRDKRYPEHHHTLLNAEYFEVMVNTHQLLNGVIDVQYITISKAAVDLYTDSTGYSNTSVFATSSNKPAAAKQSTSAQLYNFTLDNVQFKIDDQRNKKLFDFAVNNISGKLTYPDSGWTANFHLDVLTRSMTFSSTHGSFLKNKQVEGDFKAGFNKKTGNIYAISNELNIGDDPFTVNALFTTAKPAPSFKFYLTCKKLLWHHAAALLTNNITLKLNQFNILQPMGVTAIISGSFAGGGDPYLYITAAVKNSTITIPGSQIENCSFNGVFTNNYQNGKALGDDNSIIKLIKLNGTYLHMPFQIDSGNIINLTKPIATGNIKANFPIADLNQIADKRTVVFNSGTAQIDLHYKADIVDYQINKPFIAGSIRVKNANLNYIPSGLLLENASASLSFVKNDLVIKNIAMQTGRSKVVIDARVNNFLNFYYTAPEKILFTCNINSPQMYVGEFIGFLNKGKEQQATHNTTHNSGNIMKQLNTVLHRCNIAIKLKADNMHYNKFLATNVKADLRTVPGGIVFKNIGLNTSGGSLQLNGAIKRSSTSNQVSVNTVISNVNVHDFFYAFDSFGLKDLTYENLKGSLSAKTAITLAINDKAALIPKTLNGNLKVNLKNAALINFKGLQGVVKYAFPFRNFNVISIPDLDADFNVHGDKIEISPMKISSSVLNLDVAGTYGINNGTNLTFDVPLRNPKGDSTITDNAKLQKKRYKGIVLHLLAKADETGKIKIGFNKGSKETVADGDKNNLPARVSPGLIRQ